MDKKQFTTEEVAQTWQLLLERKGQPPTFEEVHAITGGNATRINDICGECRSEYLRGRRSTDDRIKKKLGLYFERMVTAAVEDSDDRVRTLQSANASALDMLSRERNGLKEQLEASQQNGRGLEEQVKMVSFELQGAQKELVAANQEKGELNTKTHKLLQAAADHANEMAAKDATIAGLRAELHAQAEDRFKLLHDRVEAAVTRMEEADGPRRKAGLK